MKIYKKLLVLLSIIPCIFLLGACSFLFENEVYVTDIVQTEVVDGVATYTVHYSDGSTSLFTVKNGEDGIDGKDLTIQAIKEYCLENDLDFEDFLAKYLTIVEESNTVQDATNTALKSAVTVWCEFPIKDIYQNKKTEIGCGAGAIYKMEENSEYSYIVTNYHVIYYTDCQTANNVANKIHIFQYGSDESVYDNGATENGYPTYTYGNGAVEAEFVGGSIIYDLAVLRVKTQELLDFNPYAKAVTLADQYYLGETAIAIGNPECEGFSVTSGIISVVSENISLKGADEETDCNFRVMRIDTAVNGGNSGGGLFNMGGELIGVVNAKAVSNDIDNIAYAIPVDNVTKVVENLIYYFEQTSSTSQVKALDLDIEYSVTNSHAVYDPTTNRTTIVDELKVTSVTLGGIGKLIGLQEGDIVKSISINGTTHTLTRAYQLFELMLTVHAGDKFILTVDRAGISKELGITTTLGVLSSQLKIIK